MCAHQYELGISYDRQWSPEIDEMIEEQNWLFRFEGALDSTALEKDLVFKGVEWHSDNISYFHEDNVFGVDLGTCPSSNDPYNTKRDADTHWDAHYRDASSPPFPFPLASSGDSCGCSITNKTNNRLFQILLLLMAAALFLHRFKRRRSSTPKS